MGGYELETADGKWRKGDDWGGAQVAEAVEFGLTVARR
jgi:hypothetical protein